MRSKTQSCFRGLFTLLPNTTPPKIRLRVLFHYTAHTASIAGSHTCIRKDDQRKGASCGLGLRASAATYVCISGARQWIGSGTRQLETRDVGYLSPTESHSIYLLEYTVAYNSENGWHKIRDPAPRAFFVRRSFLPNLEPALDIC
jgi:hypothetical protein